MSRHMRTCSTLCSEHGDCAEKGRNAAIATPTCTCEPGYADARCATHCRNDACSGNGDAQVCSAAANASAVDGTARKGQQYAVCRQITGCVIASGGGQ